MKNTNEVLYDAVCKLLKDNDFEQFLGGSRRFGWPSENSDYDLFVCYDSFNQIHKLLMEFGFEEHGGGYDGLPLITYVIKDNNQKVLIHMSITNHKEKFSEILADHNNLFQFTRVAENCQMIRRLKETKINGSYLNGSYLYKLLLVIFNIK